MWVFVSTGLKAARLMDRSDVVAAAQRAKAAGATRFCVAAPGAIQRTRPRSGLRYDCRR